MTEREKAIEKAVKLAALAKDQEGSPEGTTASEALKRLQGKWSIKDEELERLDVDTHTLDRGGSDSWRVFLVAAVATWYRVDSTHNPSNGQSRLYSVGNPKAYTQVHRAYTYLLEWLTTGFEEQESWVSAHDYGMTFVTALIQRFHGYTDRKDVSTDGAPSSEPAEGKPAEGKKPAASSESQPALPARVDQKTREVHEQVKQKPKLSMSEFRSIPLAAMRAQIVPWPIPDEGPLRKPKAKATPLHRLGQRP